MRRAAGGLLVLLSLCSCQLAFSTVGSWRAQGGPPSPISTSNVVSLPDGRVAVFGGFLQQSGQPLNQTLLYEPSTNAWSKGAVMPGPFFADVVAVLPNGQVLVEGGRDQDGNPSGATWIYDPSRDSWSQAGSVLEPRSGPAFAVLTDGRVLIVGGGLPLSQSIVLPNGNTLNFKPTPSAEIFDPRTRTWSRAGDLPAARDGISLVALAGGSALAAGGCAGTAGFEPAVAIAEIFDPTTLTWAPTAPVPQPVCGATGVGLHDGRALIVDQFGSYFSFGVLSSSSDNSFVYDPRSRTWSATGALAGGGLSAVILKDGRVLVPEVQQGAVHGHTFSESVGGQIFDPATDQWLYATTTSVPVPIAYLEQGGNELSVSLPDGTALVFLPTSTLAYHPHEQPPSTEVLDSTGLTFELGAAAIVIVLLLLLAYRRATRADISKLA